ncbi:unnamed protein product [Brassicogethes aeneus]|uniref:Myb-like domain-containing protein n=1 Tax=Brassicogethes aeneus TaxID=1431903 RepID=A0A9P0AZI3_BRAAE|nr:unnamed protein product [Brassicogethes aeneus]
MDSLEIMQESDEDNSDDALKIVIESPTKRKKFVPNEVDKQIINEVEDNIEESLGEKAAKTKLSANTVKHILKHVVTNEHVLALVRQAEHPEENDENVTVYEPKLTRAKTKELLSNVPNGLLVEPKSNSKSETHVLFSGDLQEEDSSGDEYVPGEEESEDDRDSSIVSDSDPLSVPPQTPPTPLSYDIINQTNYTEDGVFKIPPNQNLTKAEEEVNIALRTRSKLCLSSTPLEIIEEQFIPPDITTDMYDMDCDDEDWTDFLKKFTRPLDEVTKLADDEDHDPEYNILADEHIDQVDKEELRVDKAVKVSRKELNDLMAELFEFANVQFENEVANENARKNEASLSIVTTEPEQQITKHVSDQSVMENTQTSVNAADSTFKEVEEVEDGTDIMIRKNQIPLLEQQLRQHVQMLTQNFLLTYQHPEYHAESQQCKEYLMNLKFLSTGRKASIFYITNLQSAIELISNWEILYSSNSTEVQNTRRHIENDIAESLKRKNAGNYNYIYTLPPLIMDTIGKSNVFLYTSLLPKTPFKTSAFYANKNSQFLESEDSLISLGLEQFCALADDSRELRSKNGDISLKNVCQLIQEYMIPTKGYLKIYDHILAYKDTRCANNPIKYYFQTKRAPPLLHYVYPLGQLKVKPPCERIPDELPYQLKNHLFPTPLIFNNSHGNITITPVLNYLTPDNSFNAHRTLLPKSFSADFASNNKNNVGKPIITSTPLRVNSRHINKRRIKSNNSRVAVKSRVLTPLDNLIRILKKPARSRKLFDLFEKPVFESNKTLTPIKSIDHNNSTMLPSMPNLSTPIKNPPQDNNITSTENNVTSSENIDLTRRNILKDLAEELVIDSSGSRSVSSSNIAEQSTESSGNSTLEQNSYLKKEKSINISASSSSNNDKEVPSTSNEKDNLDDINALMIASSTVKPNKKEPSGAEKKRAKIRREFLANIAICSPEDPELDTQKSEMFAMAYYDKLRESLELEHYHQIMQILNDHETGDAVDLYKKVEKLLRPKYSDLADEFLLFLRDREAAAVGQLIPWIQMNTRSKFLKKLELFFKDQPAQLRKIFKCLTELSESVDVSMEKVKTTLIPMLKGNTVLVDLFLQNFMSEAPPKSLMEGVYENLDINKEMLRPDDEELCENIVIPDVEDVYGGSACICSCHKIEDPEFKSRHRHCIPCGTKFIQGKVYIQSGRGLRPATVSFLTNTNKDHNMRLNGKSSGLHPRRKRSDTSPSKQVTVSPSKDNGDEESEEDVDGKKKVKAKTPRKRKKQPDKKQIKEPQKSSRNSKNCDNDKAETSGRTAHKTIRKRIPKKVAKEIKTETDTKVERKSTEDELDTKPGSSEGQCKRLAEEPLEWDCGASMESVEAKPSSPGTQTAESESEFCEESSQDNCESDSNSSVSSCNAHSQSDSNTGEDTSWRRDEDKIILETFQKENDKEHAFLLIAKQLQNRTVSQIRSRFQTLMTLLMEQLK